MSPPIKMHEGPSEILNYLDNMKHGVVFFVGSGKTFKTGTMFSVWEHPQCRNLRDRIKAFYDPPIAAEKFLPKDQHPMTITDIFNAPARSILVLDDMPVTQQSRGSGMNKRPQQLQGVISQKKIVIHGTLQTIASGDIAFLRDQEAIFIHKWMHPSAIKYEREEYQNQCATANRKIYHVHRALREKGLRINPLYISWVPDFNKALILDPPAWYNEDIAHYRMDWRPTEAY